MSLIEVTDKKLTVIEPEKPYSEDESIKRINIVEERIENLSSAISIVKKELFERLEDYSKIIATYNKKLNTLEQVVAVAGMIGGWKLQTCNFQEDGICKLWKLSSEAIEYLRGVVVKDGKIYRVVVAKAPWFCGLCPLYKQKPRNEK